MVDDRLVTMQVCSSLLPSSSITHVGATDGLDIGTRNSCGIPLAKNGSNRSVSPSIVEPTAASSCTT